MANIHRINDYGTAGGGGGSMRNIVMGSGSDNPDDIRFVDLFFPGATMKHHIVWISFVQIAIYFLSLVPGQTNAAPTIHSLLLFGSSYSPNLKAGEVWRLVMPILLHVNLFHLFMNMAVQIALGVQYETKHGHARFWVLYGVSGLCGNLLSTAWSPCQVAVGASTSGFGLIGAMMGEILLIWHLLAGPHRSRMMWQLAFYGIYIVLFTLFLNSLGMNVDWKGHLGGAIAGFALSMIMATDQESRPPWYKTGVLVSYLSLAALTGGAILALLFIKPTCSYIPPPY